MRRSLVKFSESETSNHTPSLADFTTTTPELKFSVHTRAPKRIFDAHPCSQLEAATSTRMARPGWPERNRPARSFRQITRFHHVINSDKVFGAHKGMSWKDAELQIRGCLQRQ